MSICGLNIESDVGNLWLRHNDELFKRVFVNLVATDVSESVQETLTKRSREISEFSKSYLAYKDNPQSDSWNELAKQQKELSFPFSLLGHLEQMGQPFFSDPNNPRQAVFYGEGLLGTSWLLPVVSNPLRRILFLGRENPNTDYRYDPKTETVEGMDKLIEDYQLARRLLQHLSNSLPADDSQAKRIVVSVSANATAFARSILSQLLRDVGFNAVVLRPHTELLSHHIAKKALVSPIVISLGTVSTEMRYKPKSAGLKTVEWIWPDTGEAVDRAIEAMVQDRIRAEETEHGEDLNFDPIPLEKLYFWKDAYRSSHWPEIAQSTAFFNEFQYPYRLRDKLTFRDVRPYLSGELLCNANKQILQEPLVQGFKEIIAKGKAEPDSAAAPLLFTGSGARLSGVPEAISALYAECLGLDASKVQVTIIDQTIDAVVDAALSSAESLNEDDWVSIEDIQQSWLGTKVTEGQALEWFKTWSKTMGEERHRAALHYEMEWEDKVL
jgi:hypothetical protein